MRAPWPKSLTGRMVLLLLLTLGAAHLIGVSVFLHERSSAVESMDRDFFGLRIAPVVHLLNHTPAELHSQIAQAVSSRRVRFTVSDTAVARPGSDHRASARARAYTELLEGVATEMMIGIPHRRRMEFSIRLADGHWLNVSQRLRPRRHPWLGPPLISLLIAGVVLTLVSILLLRRMTRPMKELASAADALGRGETAIRLEETGPEEIRRTTRAFNEMSERLQRFVRDRTQMLAAISHDLRTPITSLRLRAEFIEDEENRTKILEILDEMQRMTEAVLAFVREDTIQEETRALDLSALVQSICDDLGDRGADVRFTGPSRLVFAGRPVSLKRALRNLVENAIYYGERARVTLERDAGRLWLRIDDDGPGIPTDAHERVFEPFVRLEASRNPQTGGVGLGMAIARGIVRAHGGDIELENRAEGGLRVSVFLPEQTG